MMKYLTIYHISSHIIFMSIVFLMCPYIWDNKYDMLCSAIVSYKVDLKREKQLNINLP